MLHWNESYDGSHKAVATKTITLVIHYDSTQYLPWRLDIDGREYSSASSLDKLKAVAAAYMEH